MSNEKSAAGRASRVQGEVVPFGYARTHCTPDTPMGAAEYDIEMVEGDCPQGKGWFPLYTAPQADEFRIALHEWAVAGWRSEVQNRPLVNIHRKRLDDFWREAIRKAGGDPDAIVGPDHEAIIESMRANVAAPQAETLAVAEGERLLDDAIKAEVAAYQPQFRPDYRSFWQGARFAERHHGIGLAAPTPTASIAAEAPASVPDGFWLAPMNLDDEAHEAAEGQDDDFPLAGVRSWYAARDSWLARHPAAPNSTALAAPKAEGEAVDVTVEEMVESVNGSSWWVVLRRGKHRQDDGKYGAAFKNRAEWHAAGLRWILGQGDKPNIRDFMDEPFAAPVAQAAAGAQDTGRTGGAA